jgi:hypothetical protein
MNEPDTTATESRTEYLFSYGTLQLEAVQLTIFGRRLSGSVDALPGFELVPLRIDDAAVVDLSGKTHHTMARPSGQASDIVTGTVFELTPHELCSADQYEVAAVRRVTVDLASGRKAWAYIDAGSGYPQS